MVRKLQAPSNLDEIRKYSAMLLVPRHCQNSKALDPYFSQRAIEAIALRLQVIGLQHQPAGSRSLIQHPKRDDALVREPPTGAPILRTHEKD